jgi:hypothetical protein
MPAMARGPLIIDIQSDDLPGGAHPLVAPAQGVVDADALLAD